MPKHYEEIIIGAGIAGLSYAYKSNRDFLVLEKSNKLGGSWQSYEYKGSIYEFGPNSFMNRSEELEEMIDRIGFRDQVISHDFKKSKRYFYQKGKLKLVDPQSLIFGDLLSLASKLKILTELFRRNQALSEDESIYDFFSRRFGEEVAELAGHALKGIWAGDSKMLSAQAAFPQLKELEQEHGSILGAFLQKEKTPKQSTPLATCSFINGMSSFCEALGDYIGREKIITEADIKITNYDGERYHLELNDEKLSCDTLALATKAYQAAELLQTINPLLSEALDSIYYADIELSAVTLPKSLIKDLSTFEAFGFINASNSALLGTIFSSELFQERNLEDEVLFTSFSRQPALEELITVLQDHTTKTLTKDDFNLVDSKTIKRAIPQYNIGYLKIMDKVKQNMNPNLKLQGNYIGGVSLKETIKNSHRHCEQSEAIQLSNSGARI